MEGRSPTHAKIQVKYNFDGLFCRAITQPLNNFLHHIFLQNLYFRNLINQNHHGKTLSMCHVSGKINGAIKLFKGVLIQGMTIFSMYSANLNFINISQKFQRMRITSFQNIDYL